MLESDQNFVPDIDDFSPLLVHPKSIFLRKKVTSQEVTSTAHKYCKLLMTFLRCLFSNVSPEHFPLKESDLTGSDITRTLVSVMVGNANTDLAASVQLCTRGSGQNNFERKPGKVGP